MKKSVYSVTFRREPRKEATQVYKRVIVKIEEQQPYSNMQQVLKQARAQLAEVMDDRMELSHWHVTNVEYAGYDKGDGTVIVDVRQGKPEFLKRGQKVWVRVTACEDDDDRELFGDVEWLPAVATGNLYDVKLVTGQVLTAPTDPENDIRPFDACPYFCPKGNEQCHEGTAPEPDEEEEEDDELMFSGSEVIFLLKMARLLV